jgi:peroxiredoxin
MSNAASWKRTWLALLPWVIIPLLSVQVILLTIQNTRLKVILTSMTPFGNPSPLLKSGEHVGPVSLRTLGGSSSELRYEHSKQKYLLFVFSTTCPHCEKTLPIWQSIADSNKDTAVVILGISIQSVDQTREYVLRKQPHFYVASTDSTFASRYNIAGVPETVLIDSGGIVEQIWEGELKKQDAEDIGRLLHANKAPVNSH